MFVYLNLKTNSQASDHSAAHAHLLCINFYSFSKKIIFLRCKTLYEIFNFEIDKFLQTLLRLEQWQERLAGTRQTDDRNLVWFGK
jgi:hypothetical protein